jgi:hypothetical protein
MIFQENMTEDPDEKCSICLEKLSEGGVVVKIDCGHLFHKVCYDMLDKIDRRPDTCSCDADDIDDDNCCCDAETQVKCPMCRVFSSYCPLYDSFHFSLINDAHEKRGHWR